MKAGMKAVMTASCTCGNVEIEASGAPIVSVVCYCGDCQEGARQIEALPDAGPVQDRDGGTAFIVYREDRVHCARGAEFLKSYKIKATSPTNRVVATCCNSAMYLNFDDSKHWVDVYRARFRGDAPPPQMRLCTRSKPGPDDLPGDIPNYATYPLTLVGKLLVAKIAMVLGR
jgi:hypothetical protein